MQDVQEDPPANPLLQPPEVMTPLPPARRFRPF